MATAGPPTIAGNRRMARQEAQRLLSKAVVPAGATPLSKPPAWSGPAMGTPVVGSLIDFSRSWRLSMPLSQAMAWIAAHPPRGLPQDGSTTGYQGGSANLAGYGYRGPQNRAWSSADLDVEVGARTGQSGSVLRVDAVVVWLDPVPLTDSSAGPRLRVLVNGGCPATDKSAAGVTNTGADLTDRLLPAAKPSAGLECFYYGLNGRRFELRKHVVLTASAAGQAARSMAALPVSHVIGGIGSCPMDDGSQEIIALSYPGRPDVDLWVKLNGCRTISNGFILVNNP